MAAGGANQVLPERDALAERKKSGQKSLAAGLVLICAMGFGLWRTFFRSTPPNSTGLESASPARTVLPLESFTVNLADQEEGRFLRTTMALGVDGHVPPPAKAEIKSGEEGGVSMATIRDSILTVLAQCKSDDLLQPEGKLKLKRDLVNALNRDVPALQAREVYFTEFLVQR
jgi:flagellar basal body-associated protein FliL